MAKPRFLSVKDFEKTQHYSKRNPPWLKLYRTIFGDRDFIQLPVQTRFLYFGLLMLASECDNRIVNDASWIAQRLFIRPEDIDLTPLFTTGFLLASRASIRRYRQTETDNSEQSRDKSESDALRLAPKAPASAPKILATPLLPDDRIRVQQDAERMERLLATIGKGMP